MKFLLLSLVFASSLAFGSEALTTNSMNDVVAKIQEKAKAYGKENVLLVFDIDNTILTSNTDLGSDQWYSWQEEMILKDSNCSPVCVAKDVNGLLDVQALLYTVGSMRPTEAELPAKLKAVQDSGIKVILLTSRGSEVRNLTEKAIAKNGYNFATSTLRASSDVPGTYLPYDIKNASASGLSAADVQASNLGAARAVSFMNGVYMTSGQNKGIMLKVLLAKYRMNPKAVVFADDLKKHTDRMQAIMGAATDLTTYRYGGVDAEVKRFVDGDKTAVTNKWIKLKDTLKDIGY